MLSLQDLQKSFVLNRLKPGDTAVDFTMGNGRDTLFLSRLAGEKGRVYAFDIQETALSRTKKLLIENDAPPNYTLICDSHENVKKYVPGKINAGIFNLGRLPGGDKTVTTMTKTTLLAVAEAMDMLAKDGVLVAAAYPGHTEGAEEGKAIAGYLAGLDRKKYMCAVFKLVNSPLAPYFFVVEKNF